MKIIQVDKYISTIENNNMILIFYKKDLNSIIDKRKSICYIKDNRSSNLKYIESLENKYNILNVKNLEEIQNRIGL